VKQNRIQKAAAKAIAAHEAVRAAYLIAAKANPWPESPDSPESEWDAHDERDEAIRASGMVVSTKVTTDPRGDALVMEAAPAYLERLERAIAAAA